MMLQYHNFLKYLHHSVFALENRDSADVLNKRVDFQEPFLGAYQQWSTYVESIRGASCLVKEDFTIIRSVNYHYLIAGHDLYQELQNLGKIFPHIEWGGKSHMAEKVISLLTLQQIFVILKWKNYKCDVKIYSLVGKNAQRRHRQWQFD